jgi:hypothetical protein
MKKITLTLSLLVLVIFCGFAVPNDVVYSEGDATVKFQEGYVEDVYIGDVYDTGDTVTTGYDGFVELDQEGLVLKINPDTVFTLQEKEDKGEKTGVFSLVLGSIKFRYDRMTGKEPMIQTPACVAGVRGTEFSVFAGADGSALIVVDSGQVEVESEGKAVQLTADEGVEVPLGEPPGDKFKAKRDQIDYKTWNDDKVAQLVSNPLESIYKIRDRMDFYIANTTEYYGLYERYQRQLDEERKKVAEIFNEKGSAAAQEYERENVTPIEVKALASFFNYRYFALTALSLRRYVAGRTYLFVKSRYMANLTDETVQKFLDQFEDLLEAFENSIVSKLVEADI